MPIIGLLQPMLFFLNMRVRISCNSGLGAVRVIPVGKLDAALYLRVVGAASGYLLSGTRLLRNRMASADC